MKSKLFIASAVVAMLVLTATRTWSAEAVAVDIKRAAPTDAFLAVYARHNPERDYQRQYGVEAWKTFQQEHIGERVLGIITSHVPSEQLTAAKTKLQELHTAIEPIEFQAILNAQEFVLTESFDGPFNQVLVAIRLNAADAANCERAYASPGAVFPLERRQSARELQSRKTGGRYGHVAARGFAVPAGHRTI